MDSRQMATKLQIERGLTLIKSRMPSTYKTIQDRVKVAGNVVYALVRSGLGGKPNAFWAIEGGYIVGTPFAQTNIERDVAYSMVAFGVDQVCIFGAAAVGGEHGTN